MSSWRTYVSAPLSTLMFTKKLPVNRHFTNTEYSTGYSRVEFFMEGRVEILVLAGKFLVE